jgi:hypothetical protein
MVNERHKCHNGHGTFGTQEVHQCNSSSRRASYRLRNYRNCYTMLHLHLAELRLYFEQCLQCPSLSMMAMDDDKGSIPTWMTMVHAQVHEWSMDSAQVCTVRMVCTG